MANMLDRNNQHLLLEKTDNTNSSFIANINKLATKLNIIIEAVGLFDENVIPILEEIAELDLGAAIEDLEKGSYLGNRKIDINLLYNMTDIDVNTDEAVATEAWLDSTKTVMYSGATALFKDGTSIYIPFMFDKNPVNISTHADLLLQLNANQEFLEKLNNTLIASFAHPVVGEILRIYDVDGVASNLDRLTLHAVTGSFKEANTAYYWTKSTSALQTLAMRVGDINMIGSNIESFIALANNVIQLVNLQERIPELVDTYTDGVANGDVTLYNNLTKLIALHTNLGALQVLHTNINKIISVEGNISLIQEVSDNIVPNLTAILSSYTHAMEAKNAANTAKGYSDSAATSAATALTKANEIKKVTVGSTTTAVAGSSASVVYDTNSGKFHFVIPQGVKGDKGDAFTINARGTTEQRSLYDNQVAGFSFFDLNSSKLYLKLTNASGNWSDGIQFGKGDPGEDGAAGVGISSITFTSTTDSSGNPGQHDAVDTYSINYTDGSTTTFTVANGNSFNLPVSTSKVYVSKQGNDLNSGLSIEKPKTTIANAISAASALLADNPRAVVEVMDAEQYQEDITIPQNIMVRGSDAMLEGTVVLNNNSYFDMYAHYARVSDSVMVSKVGNSHSYYKVVVQDAGGTLGSLTGCTNLRSNATGGILFAQIELQKVTHVGIKEETTTGVGHIHVRIKDMYLTADNAIGIYGVGTASDIVGTVDHILMNDSLSNTRGIVFDSTNGSLNITSNKIAAATAYSVTSGKVKISCPDITGITSGNADVVLTTGNISDSLDLDSSTTSASSKAVKTVNDKLTTTQTELQEAIDNISPATTTARGIGRVATSDDLVDGATINNGPAFLAAGVHTSVAAAGGKIPVANSNGHIPQGWLGTMLCNQRTTITTSGTYTYPVDGWYRKILIGGGGAGGSGLLGTYAGIQGGGGGAGQVKTALEWHSAGNVEPINIGAGGTPGAVGANGGDGGNTSIGSTTAAGGKGGKNNGGASALASSKGGKGYGSGGSGTGFFVSSSGFGIPGSGGCGGSNGSDFGGGGGGGSTWANGIQGSPGTGGSNALDGTAGTADGTAGVGGYGGNGAVIIEYFNPSITS